MKQLREDLKKGIIHNEHSRFNQLISRYKEKFGEVPAFEPFDYLEDMWYIILLECIKQEKTIDELLENENSFDREWYD